jgi:hypothetical protein
MRNCRLCLVNSADCGKLPHVSTSPCRMRNCRLCLNSTDCGKHPHVRTPPLQLEELSSLLGEQCGLRYATSTCVRRPCNMKNWRMLIENNANCGILTCVHHFCNMRHCLFRLGRSMDYGTHPHVGRSPLQNEQSYLL